MTSEYLEYFVEVCNCGSIQSASKKLYISSQGIGKGIQRLEQALGVQLLERTSFGVTPTEFGRIFYEQACVVNRELNKLMKLTEQYKQEKKKRIVIGTLGKNKYLSGMSACVQGFQQKNPDKALDVSVQVVKDSAELLGGVRSGAVDIGWIFHWREYPDLKYHPVSDASRLLLLVCADDPLARQATVKWEQLKNVRFITAGEDDPFSDMIKAMCENKGFSPSIAFYSTENTTIANVIDNNIAAILLRENYYMSIARFCRNARAVPVEPEVCIANSLVIRAGNTGGIIEEYLRYMLDFMRNTMGFGATYT